VLGRNQRKTLGVSAKTRKRGLGPFARNSWGENSSTREFKGTGRTRVRSLGLVKGSKPLTKLRDAVGLERGCKEKNEGKKIAAPNHGKQNREREGGLHSKGGRFGHGQRVTKDIP